jgi:hypothetical protein
MSYCSAVCVDFPIQSTEHQDPDNRVEEQGGFGAVASVLRCIPINPFLTCASSSPMWVLVVCL